MEQADAGTSRSPARATIVTELIRRVPGSSWARMHCYLSHRAAGASGAGTLKADIVLAGWPKPKWCWRSPIVRDHGGAHGRSEQKWGRGVGRLPPGSSCAVARKRLTCLTVPSGSSIIRGKEDEIFYATKPPPWRLIGLGDRSGPWGCLLRILLLVLIAAIAVGLLTFLWNVYYR